MNAQAAADDTPTSCGGDRQDVDDVLARLRARVEKDPELLEALVLLADMPVDAVSRRSTG